MSNELNRSAEIEPKTVEPMTEFESATCCLRNIEPPDSNEPTKQVDTATKQTEMPGSEESVPNPQLGTEELMKASDRVIEEAIRNPVEPRTYARHADLRSFRDHAIQQAALYLQEAALIQKEINRRNHFAPLPAAPAALAAQGVGEVIGGLEYWKRRYLEARKETKILADALEFIRDCTDDDDEGVAISVPFLREQARAALQEVQP